MPSVILWTVESLCWRGYIVLRYRTVHKFIPSSTICQHLHLKFSSILAVSKIFTETAGFQVRFRFPGCFTLEIQNLKPLTGAENGCKSSIPDTTYSELRFWLSFGKNQRVSGEQTAAQAYKIGDGGYRESSEMLSICTGVILYSSTSLAPTSIFCCSTARRPPAARTCISLSRFMKEFNCITTGTRNMLRNSEHWFWASKAWLLHYSTEIIILKTYMSATCL